MAAASDSTVGPRRPGFVRGVPFFTESDMSVVADKPKRKFLRINSGRDLVRLLKETGTRGRVIDHLEALFPRDRYGNLTGKDVPADDLVDRVREIMEREAAGETVCLKTWDGRKEEGLDGLPDVAGLPISQLMFDKIVSIRKKGFWEPVAEAQPAEFPVEFAAEEYDPEEEDGDGEGDGKAALPVKRKAGRPPGAKNKPAEAKAPVPAPKAEAKPQPPQPAMKFKPMPVAEPEDAEG